MLDEFRSWAVARAKLARATIRYTTARMAYMQAHGLDWQRFVASPEGARREGDAFLGRQGLRSDSRHALRTYEKVLNLAVRFAADRQPTMIWPKWDLTREPRHEGRTLTEPQVAALMAYRNRNSVREARRRALAWLGFWTRLRRSEIARLRLRDFNAETRRVWVEFPAKGGKKRWKPLPGNAWHPNGAMQRWLRVRPRPADGSDWLWTAQNQRRGAYSMAVDSVGNEFQKMGRELGFGVSFVRTRRAGAQFLQRHEVRTRIIKADLSHSDESVTEIYLGADSADDIEAEFERRRVPGFANRSRGSAGSRIPPGDFRG